MTHRSTQSILALGLLGLLAASPALAQDSECDTDTDCEASFVCEVTGGGDCAQAPCSADGECPAPICDAVEYRECVPGPCESDADCEGDQVCVIEVYTSTGGDCSPGTDCQTTEPVEEVYSECRNRWEAPCEVAGDCGPGFNCEEAESCSCGGSAGSGCVEGEPCPEPDPVEPECGCEPSGDFYCVLEVVECTGSAECSDGMVCDSNPSRAVCTSAGGDPDGTPSDPASDPCGNADEPEKICMPEGYYGDGVDFGRGGVGGEAQSGSSDATASDGSDSDETSGSTMGKGGNDTVCSVSAVGAGSRGGLLWLLAAAAFLVRRRRA